MRVAAGQAIGRRKVGLVGAGAVVVGAARVDREAERHRLQRARLVAGELQALHVRRERRRALADTSAAAREPWASSGAEPLARADLVDARAAARRRRRSAATARRSGRARRTPSPTRSSRPAEIVSRPGRRSGRSPPGRRRDRRRRTAGRARRRSRTPRGLACRRRPCRCARSRSSTRRSCPARRRGPRRGPPRRGRRLRNVGGLEVAGRQRGDGVEREQVGQRAELAVLRGRGAERARAQVARGGEHRRGSAGATFVAGRTAIALSSFEPRTAPRPPRPACRPSCETVAYFTRRSPAGPIEATRHALPSRSRSRASASAAESPQRSPAGSSRAPSPSTSRTDGSRTRRGRRSRRGR